MLSSHACAHIHVSPASDHIYEFDVVDVPVGEWLVNLLVLLDALLEVIHSLRMSQGGHMSHGATFHRGAGSLMDHC